MKTYIGTKIIKAEPSAKDGVPGYSVVYPDGYTSWSPSLAFDEAYRESGALTFGLAMPGWVASQTDMLADDWQLVAQGETK